MKPQGAAAPGAAPGSVGPRRPRIAWIGAPPAAERAGARLRELLPHLREETELTLYVEPGREAEVGAELPARPVSALVPREHDQLVYALADEPELAFALPVLRRVGGTVLLETWELSRLARAAFPGLAGRGARAGWLVVREGGLEALRAWRRGGAGGEACAGLALNRSVVRHADAFLVRDEDTARRIRLDRNAHTPIGVLGNDGLAEEARRVLLALERFPHARSARRPLLVAALRARGDLRARGADR